MRTLDFNGLNENKVQNVVKALAALLADLQVYYTNLRGFHWNIKGESFFVMHEKYEEMYDDTATKIDEVAERILQLGQEPESRFSEYLKVAEIAEAPVVTTGREAAELLLGWMKTLIAKEREIIRLAGDAGDDVTADLMTGYLAAQEKMLWMLVAYYTRPENSKK